MFAFVPSILGEKESKDRGWDLLRDTRAKGRIFWHRIPRSFFGFVSRSRGESFPNPKRQRPSELREEVFLTAFRTDSTRFIETRLENHISHTSTNPVSFPLSPHVPQTSISSDLYLKVRRPLPTLHWYRVNQLLSPSNR